MGEMYPSNSYGIAFNKLSQGQTQLGAHRQNMLSKVIGDKFLTPLNNALENDKKNFAAQDKEIRSTMTQYGQDIKKMMSQAQKEQKKGTDAMLSALSLVNNKVQEFDSKNQTLLESLEKSEQERFVSWFQRWATVMDSQLHFHAESAKKLRELEQVWNEAVGAPKDPSNAAAADESIHATAGVGGDDDADADDDDDAEPDHGGKKAAGEPQTPKGTAKDGKAAKGGDDDDKDDDGKAKTPKKKVKAKPKKDDK
jgi:hypothetical protein